MNPKGNATALAKWRSTQTPEQLHALSKRGAAKRRASSSAHDVAITVVERTQGKNLRGGSRTVVLRGCPMTCDQVRDRLVPLLEQLRQPSNGTAHQTVVLIFTPNGG